MKIIIIKTKTELHDTITSIDNFDAVLEYDPVTKTFKMEFLKMEGICLKVD